MGVEALKVQNALTVGACKRWARCPRALLPWGGPGVQVEEAELLRGGSAAPLRPWQGHGRSRANGRLIL